MTTAPTPDANLTDAGVAPEVATLNAYLDGELSAADAARVEAQLATDVSARVLLKSLTVQREALARRYTLPVDCPVTKALAAKVLGGG